MKDDLTNSEYLLSMGIDATTWADNFNAMLIQNKKQPIDFELLRESVTDFFPWKHDLPMEQKQ